MGFLGKVKLFCQNSEMRFEYLNKIGFFNFLSDEEFLKVKYKVIFGRPLDLETPIGFNEKLQWLKLHDRRPEYTTMVDKYRVRDFIRQKLGEDYLIPLVAVWDDPEEIDFNLLPDRFVLKCNHNSGLGLCICKDKSKLDVKRVKAELSRGLRQDYYKKGREWPYKNVPRKIICEQYMEDAETGELRDYKFFCFNGVVDNVMVVVGRSEGNPLYYHFDRDYKLQRFNRLTRSLPEGYSVPKPQMLDEMIRIAEVLSKGVPHVRIDLYLVNGKIYFGEYTLYNQSGFETGFDEYSNNYLGNLIDMTKAENWEETIKC